MKGEITGLSADERRLLRRGLARQLTALKNEQAAIERRDSLGLSYGPIQQQIKRQCELIEGPGGLMGRLEEQRPLPLMERAAAANGYQPDHDEAVEAVRGVRVKLGDELTAAEATPPEQRDLTGEAQRWGVARRDAIASGS